MFKNNLKIAFRNFIKYKTYSFINVAGLAIGLAAAIVIGVYVFTELSYDKFHEKAERIYRIGTFLEFGGNGGRMASTNFTVGPTLKRDYPEVEQSVRLRRFADVTPINYKEIKYTAKDVFYADPPFFKIFTFKTFSGNPESALEQPYSVVLTKTIADKIFKNEQPIGKTLQLSDNKNLFTVTAIVEDVPQNSHFTFTMLCSFESMREQVGAQMEQWMGDFQNYTYILLNKGVDHEKFEAIFPPLVQNNVGELLTATHGKFEFFLEPLHTIYLYSNTLNIISKSGDIRYIYLFSSIAFLILLIACINFLNLATARSLTRFKEIGVKKVLGTKKSQLIFQFLWESIFFTVFAVIIALILISILWPVIQQFTGLEVSVIYDNAFLFTGGLTFLTIFIGLVAGSYPAFYLSAFNPHHSLKDSKVGRHGSHFRSILVVVQFAISIMLVVGSLIIANQLHYVQNKKMGFKKDNVVVVPFDYKASTRSVESLKSDLLANPDILGVTTSSNSPGHGARGNIFIPEGFTAKDAPMVNAINVDTDFLTTMKLDLIEGRNFSDMFPSDRDNSIIINEALVKRFGWKNPVGKKITEARQNQPAKTVIGIVADYHFVPLQYKINPLVIENERDTEDHRVNYFLVGIAPNNVKKSVEFIQSVLENKNSLQPYEYIFLDDSFNTMYHSEMFLSRIFSYFTAIAISLACLGLFGLAAYTEEQRTKEIGIRKVLGASVAEVFILLSKEFMKWVLIANVIAWPVAYYFMNKWLQDFAYRIDIDWWIFALSGGIALLIALATVSFQAIKAAMANPVESLRYE
jgi:putative ABC transport system permease protein